MSFKHFDLTSDVVTLESATNEVVVVTGSIFVTDSNVKFYQNIASSSVDPNLGGYFQTGFDSNPTSSLSTALFDISYGFATGSIYNVSVTTSSSQNQKIKIHREYAGLLLGNKDAHFTIGGVERKEAIFVHIKRDIFKDELKKGTTSFCINSSLAGVAQYSASDAGAVTSFKQTVGGDYAPLKIGGTGSEVGQVWYNAGVIVLHPDTAWGAITIWSGSKTLINNQSSGSINNIVDGFRRKVDILSFHNQTNIRSTAYFCRATNTEFNYSSNSTFVDDNKRIRVTSGSNNQLTRTFITTVGLYDANDNILAVGKTNKPITKSPENEATIRLRLDY